MAGAITQSERDQIDELVEFYLRQQTPVILFRNSITDAFLESRELQQLIHSTRSRLKDPDHLRAKLLRKLQASKATSEPFQITKGNLFERINDLAGIRLLHLYTRQLESIDKVLKSIFHEMAIPVREGPFARTWDDESRSFFEEIGIQTQASPTMYTSVHYVVASNSRTLVTCEIQVRTLMEEVWGEVDHAVNYPRPTDSVPCREQIRALARSTSSATRLVDAIFATVADIEAHQALNQIPKLRGPRVKAKRASKAAAQRTAKTNKRRVGRSIKKR